jgi:hypothetical protein
MSGMQNGPQGTGLAAPVTTSTSNLTPATLALATLTDGQVWAGDIVATASTAVVTAATSSVWTSDALGGMPTSGSIIVGGVTLAFPSGSYADGSAWLVGIAAQPGIASCDASGSIVITADPGANVTTVATLVIDTLPVTLTEDPVGADASTAFDLVTIRIPAALYGCAAGGGVNADSATPVDCTVGDGALATATAVVASGTGGAMNVTLTGVDTYECDWSVYIDGQVVQTVAL